MKNAVFSCQGLGDGLLALILSNNLQKQGEQVVTFHPFLQGLQSWFPHLPLSSFPSVEELAAFDRFFIIYEKSPWMLHILSYCETHFPEKTFVLNPIATANRDYPYWEIGRFDGKKTFATNLTQYCKDRLEVKNPVKHNGITSPQGIMIGQFPKRIVLHPTSSRPGKNWPQEKFLALADLLLKRGYEPALILTKEERISWPNVNFSMPEFSSLSEVASFVAESGAMIGNDSGIGHLASALGLSTVTICRSKMTGRFWRPDLAPNILVTPPSYLPNLKGLRLRDKYWKHSISVSKVLDAFLQVYNRLGKTTQSCKKK